MVNGQQVGRICNSNDSSIARETLRSGVCQKNDWMFDARPFRPGQNTMRFGASVGGLMCDTVVLESD